jgi:hypothetical protein
MYYIPNENECRIVHIAAISYEACNNILCYIDSLTFDKIYLQEENHMSSNCMYLGAICSFVMKYCSWEILFDLHLKTYLI